MTFLVLCSCEIGSQIILDVNIQQLYIIAPNLMNAGRGVGDER